MTRCGCSTISISSSCRTRRAVHGGTDLAFRSKSAHDARADSPTFSYLMTGGFLVKSPAREQFFVQSCGILIPQTSEAHLVTHAALETVEFASFHVQGPDASRFGILSRVEVAAVHLDKTVRSSRVSRRTRNVNSFASADALTELGAEQKKSAIAVTNTTRKTALGRIGMRRDQVEYGCEKVRTRKQLLSAPM